MNNLRVYNSHVYVLLIYLFIITINSHSLNATSNVVNLKLRIDFHFKRATDKTLSVLERAAAYDSIISLTKPYTKADMFFNKGELLTFHSFHEEALDTYKEASLYIHNDSLSDYCALLANIAFSSIQTHRYIEATETSLKLINIQKPDSLLFRNIDAYILLLDIFKDKLSSKNFTTIINKIYYDLGRYKKNNPQEDFINYSLEKIYAFEAMYYVDKGDYENAYKAMHKLDSIPSIPFVNLRKKALWGHLYHLSSEFDLAEKNYQEVLKTSTKSDDRAFTVINYADILLKTNRLGELDTLLTVYHNDLDFLHGSNNEPNLYLVLYNRAKRLGDWEEAAIALEKAYNLKDSLTNIEKQMYFKELIETVENNSVISQAKTEIKNSKIKLLIITGLFVVLIFVVFFSIYGIMYFIGKQKKFKNLFNRTVQRIKDKEKKVSDINRELTVLAQHLFSLEECINNIENITKDSSLNKVELKNKITAILKNIKLKQNTKNVFNQQIDGTNKELFDKLYYICPSLSKTEMRMCGFISNNLSSKEIADLTNRSVHTVNCIKYNIRKKLGIDGSIEAYIRIISITSITDLNEHKDNIPNCPTQIKNKEAD